MDGYNEKNDGMPTYSTFHNRGSQFSSICCQLNLSGRRGKIIQSLVPTDRDFKYLHIFCKLTGQGTSKSFDTDEIIREIDGIREGRVTVIEVNNLKKCRWIGDFVFDRNDMDDPIFGEAGFEKVMRKVQKPLSFFKKLFHAKIQYDIYDFERYQCIIKG